MPASTLSLPPKTRCVTPTRYEPKFTEIITEGMLIDKSKTEILKLWGSVDQDQRDLRYQHSYSCWCQVCEASFQGAYQPGHFSCVYLEKVYRALLKIEWDAGQVLMATVSGAAA